MGRSPRKDDRRKNTFKRIFQDRLGRKRPKENQRTNWQDSLEENSGGEQRECESLNGL